MLEIKNRIMKIYNILLIVGVIFTSCDTTYYDLPPEIDYNFEMVGRCPQDDNGYYHLKLINGIYPPRYFGVVKIHGLFKEFLFI